MLELDRGGLETMCADLAIALVERGLRSVIIGLDRGGTLEPRLQTGGVEFISMGGRSLRDPRFHWRVRSAIRQLRPTAIHAHSFGPLVYAVPATWFGGCRLVNTEHSIEYLTERRDLRRTLSWMARSIDTFVVLGERMRRYYEESIGISPERIRVIPNGVAVPPAPLASSRTAARRALGIGEGFVVATVGRLAPEKNFPMLVEAFALATAAEPHATLLFVGDGAERESLAQQAAGLGIGDRVRFLGWRTDVDSLLPAFDLFVLSSLSEGLPMAMLEAMAAGVPVVSTAVGDIPDVICDGVSGRLVPALDVRALGDVLAELQRSPEALGALGAGGRARVIERYSRTAMVDAYLEAYGIRGSASAAA